MFWVGLAIGVVAGGAIMFLFPSLGRRGNDLQKNLRKKG